MATTVNIMSWNYGHLAAQAIESVLNQTKPFDIVKFYDDGAGDCEHLAEIYPEVHFILRQTNIGVIRNFNDALDNTETEKVLFLGADNWLMPHTHEILSKSDADIVSYWGWKWSDKIEKWEINQAHGSSLYDVVLAKEVGGYEHSGNEHAEEDSMLFNKMIDKGAKLEVIPQYLLQYRWNHRKNFNKHED